jgi:hypothetical protein
MDDELAARFAAVHDLFEHRHNEQLPIRKPSDPRRSPWDVTHTLPPSGEVDGEHPTLKEIGVPQTVFVPARTLTKVQSVDEDLHILHALANPRRPIPHEFFPPSGLIKIPVDSAG